MKRMRCVHRHRIGGSDAGPRIASPALAKPMWSIGIASISDAISNTLLAMPILSAGIACQPEPPSGIPLKLKAGTLGCQVVPLLYETAHPPTSTSISSPTTTTPLRDSSPSYIDKHLIPNDRQHSSSYLSVHSLPHISPIKF
ncbi:hypothetical protein PGTUg99_018009 [Puccinia graminis f. sp. tritici]|uniref:Uncharacterized protein n=1 Tax=Puccinia graminis f. sp. tritici TaxID=56615 RepID=A0A5B0LL13_PUCGR|nr:hypothetical protein PGTUg99_018009 [Puccinia graminis f. sp. tritici]